MYSKVTNDNKQSVYVLLNTNSHRQMAQIMMDQLSTTYVRHTLHTMYVIRCCKLASLNEVPMYQDWTNTTNAIVKIAVRCPDARLDSEHCSTRGIYVTCDALGRQWSPSALICATASHLRGINPLFKPVVTVSIRFFFKLRNLSRPRDKCARQQHHEWLR